MTDKQHQRPELLPRQVKRKQHEICEAHRMEFAEADAPSQEVTHACDTNKTASRSKRDPNEAARRSESTTETADGAPKLIRADKQQPADIRHGTDIAKQVRAQTSSPWSTKLLERPESS